MNEQALKHKLKVTAKELGITFNETWHTLVLERFLVRVSNSSHKDSFVFKGGFLLARYINLDRETRDLDFLIKKIKAERPTIQRLIEDITVTKVDDGFLFQVKSIDDLPHQHMKYPGFQITLEAIFFKQREPLTIDIGIGDEVDQVEDSISLTSSSGNHIFEDKVSLLVYPPETIFAEKLQTAIARGDTNSRMKDYHDMFLLISSGVVLSSTKTTKAIKKTFKNRGTSIGSLPVVFDEYEIDSLNKYWMSHLRKLRIESREQLPKSIHDIITALNGFLEDIGF